jgi:MarR family transcriptional regulator, organic hydroperoxide resistance regulator
MPRGSSSRTASVPDIGDRVLQVMGLIWAVDHQLHSVSKRMERTIGLTVPQRMALLFIGRYPGILAKEIAARLHLHPGTVSGILRRLQAGGYLTRRAQAGDARRAELTLTLRGRAANGRRAGTFEAAVLTVLESTPAMQVRAAEGVLIRLAEELARTAAAVGEAAGSRRRPPAAAVRPARRQ